MKNDFIGYYDLDETAIEHLWTEGTFAFDANTLLNLYRYSEEARTAFLEVLDAMKERLYLPYQAALEFHNNRKKVIASTISSYKELGDAITENFEKQLSSQLNRFKKHPTISVEKIKRLHEDFTKKVNQELETQQSKHPDFKKSDEVLEKLTVIFENSTGKKPTKKDLELIYAEGAKRYAEKIPPGFQDTKKQDNDKYGDLVIWLDLIAHAKKDNKPFVFITDDRKDDWWQQSFGQESRPHPELIKEFYDKSGIRLMIYNADQFLREAKNRNILPSLTEDTINEIKDVRISEQQDDNLDYWKFDYSDISSKFANRIELLQDTRNNFHKYMYDNSSEHLFEKLLRDKLSDGQIHDEEYVMKMKAIIDKINQHPNHKKDEEK